MKTMPSVVVDDIDVGVRTGKTRHLILRGLSFRVEGSGRLVLLGANGAGKTTLLRTLTRLVLPSRGSIEINGIDLARSRRALQNVAYCPDADRAVQPGLSAIDNARTYLLRHGARFDEKVFWSLAERLGLGAAARSDVAGYSKGMRQKASLIGPLMLPANIILLDEPTNGLDEDAARELRSILISKSESGSLVLAATHDLRFAEAIATGVVLLESGRVGGFIKQDELHELKRFKSCSVLVSAALNLAMPPDGWTIHAYGSDTLLTRPDATDDDISALLNRLLACGNTIQGVWTDSTGFFAAHQRYEREKSATAPSNEKVSA